LTVAALVCPSRLGTANVKAQNFILLFGRNKDD
jgi:hypothetical protein